MSTTKRDRLIQTLNSVKAARESMTDMADSECVNIVRDMDLFIAKVERELAELGAMEHLPIRVTDPFGMKVVATVYPKNPIDRWRVVEFTDGSDVRGGFIKDGNIVTGAGVPMCSAGFERRILATMRTMGIEP